jgi:plasmid maintenance system antidote protein VapI
MKDRLVKLLQHYQISPAQLADNMGVQRSSISHILSGRNKPSFDFLIKLLENYSDLSAEWMLLGKGEMLKSVENTPSNKENSNLSDLFTQVNQQSVENEQKLNKTIRENSSSTIPEQLENDRDSSKFTNVNSIKQIILVYENDTFKIINKQ